MCSGEVGVREARGMCTRGSPVEIREQLYFWGVCSPFSLCFGGRVFSGFCTIALHVLTSG